MGSQHSSSMLLRALSLSLAVVFLFAVATALPTSDTPPMNVSSTVNGDQPCCQGKCTTSGQEKYWSIAKGILGETHCGECCMDPKDYKLYHFFEKNLTKSDTDSPCKTFGFTKYDSTVTHGFGPVKMTLDLYDEPSNKTGHCNPNEYCCPDAKACLLPTEISCKDGATACGKGEVCCPLTKICVVPRQPCVTPCADAGSYCCPVTKHCVTPTSPGDRCHGPSDCAQGEACCPTTKVCVKIGETCTPPLLPFL